MSNLYRGASPRHRNDGSRVGAVLKVLVLIAVAVGIFVLAVRWFRRDDSGDMADADDVAVIAEGSDTALRAAALLPEQSTITLSAVEGESGGATATRSHVYGEYSLSIVADLPAVDGTTTAYEAWFVTPGITNFFSLGEMYPREDGKWGLVWTQVDALVRNDIAEFNRIIVIREPRDGNTGPSADHVLNGVFE